MTLMIKIKRIITYFELSFLFVQFLSQNLNCLSKFKISFLNYFKNHLIFLLVFTRFNIILKNLKVILYFKHIYVFLLFINHPKNL